MRRIILFIIILFGFWNSLTAASFPFTDVNNSDTLYTHLNRMISAGWVLDDRSGIFAWGSPASRDFFTALILSAKCQSCIVPQGADITTYNRETYDDVTMSNPYFYCIEKTGRFSYLDIRTSCTSGFCPSEWVTRIEAVKWLLRSANIWRDTMQVTGTSTTIGDIPSSSRDYGYAIKWLELWIIQRDPNGNIYPDTVISRSEAITMASKVLSFTQCTPTFGEPIQSKSWVTLTSSGISNTYTMTLSGASGNSYRWSLGDGMIRTTTTPSITYTYSEAWTYNVSVYLVTWQGNTILITTSVRATGIQDTDKDGMYDDTDICPFVVWPTTNKGCPVISTRKYGDTISDLLAGMTRNTDFSLLSGITTNACLLRQKTNNWLIIAEPVCDQCPCQNRVTILSDLRSCDIIFPSILSPDMSLIYSRGSFYQIP